MDGSARDADNSATVRALEVVPSAGRTIASLRDIGYELPQAVADLVDNSIEAGATEIHVDIRFKGSRSWIRVADDGRGMTPEQLTESLRIGSVREYEDDDLGKFGFGLKTASISQCRRVSVASRTTANEPVAVRVFDLDHIQRTDRWEILAPDDTAPDDPLLEPLIDSPGTVVLWENLDRVLVYKDPAGYWAQKKMLELAEFVDVHLAMVFHRFVAGNAGGRAPVRIHVNGSVVEPWDPFCLDEPSTTTMDPNSYEVVSDGNQGIVTLRPYVLPGRAEFTSAAAWNRASGPNKWNNQQGIYVFRANRLIQWGGWNKLRTNDEHNKLARVALEFSPDLDAAFGINIAKATVNLPAQLREDIRPAIRLVSQAATDRYRRADRPARPTNNPSTPTPPPATETIPSPVADRTAENSPPRSTPEDGSPITSDSTPSGDGSAPDTTTSPLGLAIARAAEVAGETTALSRIMSSLRTTNPEAAHELGW